MASKTSIANRALSKLGQPRVSNVETTNTKAARTINGMWDNIRDAMLEEYPWNFAIKQTNLAPDATNDSWEYDKAYTMPSDFLSLMRIKDSPDYCFQNKKIYTDESNLIYIEYISQVTNTGDWPLMFAEAMASRLAYESSEEITTSNTKRDILFREAQQTLAIAKQKDSMENPIRNFEQDDWLDAR